MPFPPPPEGGIPHAGVHLEGGKIVAKIGMCKKTPSQLLLILILIYIIKFTPPAYKIDIDID
jgi:hypothetical protein